MEKYVEMDVLDKTAVKTLKAALFKGILDLMIEYMTLPFSH